MSRRGRFRSMFTPGSRACAYKTASGRGEWPNRDPIGERGGANLHGFGGNDAINYFDDTGLTITRIPGSKNPIEERDPLVTRGKPVLGVEIGEVRYEPPCIGSCGCYMVKLCGDFVPVLTQRVFYYDDWDTVIDDTSPTADSLNGIAMFLGSCPKNPSIPIRRQVITPGGISGLGFKVFADKQRELDTRTRVSHRYYEEAEFPGYGETTWEQQGDTYPCGSPKKISDKPCAFSVSMIDDIQGYLKSTFQPQFETLRMGIIHR